MANPPLSAPLSDRISRRNNISRAIELIILFLLFSLLLYRLLSLKDHGFTWVLALLCESWFTFTWVLVISTKWNQVDYLTYTKRLLQRKLELPPVDMFVTTADPALEPPILTVNTVLSLLAVDYPADKLACYVSDDGASPLTFYSLVEASKFAKIWVPFCKKYNVQIRAPFRFFSVESTSPQDVSLEFQQEWKKMKDEYEKLSQKIEDASKRSQPCELTGDFADFTNIQRKNHPTIIKVIWENKEGVSNGVPHVIYVSREKRPKHLHHFKAGAMNILTRVSGVITNAPFMLNLDCDMYVNNPQIVVHAMCLLLGVTDERDCAFVQSPQIFYDGLKDDPFGNQMVVLFHYMGHGIVGIQGPFYGGTGCFHRRKVIYCLSPDDNDITRKLSKEALLETFGRSMEFTKSAANILSGLKTSSISPNNISSCIETAHQVAGCDYEYGSSWGRELHSKKRNRLEQQRLNDLVYVKYNRTLRFRYDMRNTLDPISLQNIDESNEWLLGRMDGESDEDNEPVFDDDDGLTWATVARASGVEESSHASRATSSRSKAQPRISKPSTLTPLQLIDEEEAGSDDTEDEDVEGYKSTDGEEDDSLLAIDVEDDD
ncbi:hypothetical protein CsSME_00019250 [Camellia sinensis var. sinensis]